MPKKGYKQSEEHKIKLKEKKKGILNPNWKGGKLVRIEGYVSILKPNHPHSNAHGYVKRSRLVMEQYLGRHLKPGEIPHHKNEIKHDDRIENLRLFSSLGKHTAFHNHLRNSRL